jgi:glycosyltransferase involved in cell wall biosynthesis
MSFSAKAMSVHPPHRKILMVAPMPTPGTYIGGIAVLLSRLLECWNLPYEVLTYNTNLGPRDYGSVNKVNTANIGRFFRNARGLRVVARREHPFIVHFHTSRHLAMLKDLLLVAVLKANCRCKVVGHIHHASYPSLLIGSSKAGRLLQLQLLMASFDRILLMSESIQRELSQKMSRSGLQRFTTRARVVHNFIPLPELSEKSGDRSSPVTLFFIGNVGVQKGIPDLIESAGALQRAGMGFKLVLAGPFDSPSAGEQMKRRVADLGLDQNIRFTGPVFGEEKAALFQAADIFVLPSYGEGVPLSMLEAMSYGLPVVATAVGGIPEVMAHQEMGLLVKPADITALGMALQKLIGSSELRQKMGRLGRRRVEEFHSPARFLSELGAIYAELTEEHALPGAAPARPPRQGTYATPALDFLNFNTRDKQ